MKKDQSSKSIPNQPVITRDELEDLVANIDKEFIESGDIVPGSLFEDPEDYTYERF